MGNQKTFFISFFIVAVVLFALSVTSANPYIVSITSVTVNNVQTYGTNSYNSVAIFGGNSIPITVIFTANVDESNVRMSADLQGLSSDIQNQISVGDIVAGQTYIETLYLSVPTDVGDVQSGNINLVLNVWNGDSSVAETTQTIQLLDQRQSYNIQVMSIN